MILLYTGLRLCDAVRLEWDHVSDDGFIEIVTQKTGQPVSIPIAEELAKELSKPRRGHLAMMTATDRQYNPGWCSRDISSHLSQVGLGAPPPRHGLRKNAVMKLIEDGNSVDIIHSITGQSKAMIEHYGQNYERRKLARKAVITPRFSRG